MREPTQDEHEALMAALENSTTLVARGKRVSELTDLLSCPCCGCDAGIDRDNSIFNGQNYGDRYPPEVAKQNHGFKVRCHGCGIQTCYWHYELEAVEAWNKRAS